MASMSERKRTAARLRHIPDQYSFPSGSFRGQRREPFQELH